MIVMFQPTDYNLSKIVAFLLEQKNWLQRKSGLDYVEQKFSERLSRLSLHIAGDQMSWLSK